MVDHNILVKKLGKYGIRWSSQKWIEFYLSSRKQITKVNNVKSSSLPISVGVPQGSIFGLLLSSIYINDLPLHLVKCKTNLYADDTALTVARKNVDDVVLKLNDQLCIVSDWFTCNRLSLNHEKTKFMLFSTRTRIYQLPNYPVRCGEKYIEKVSTFRYLGVKLDSLSNFHEHVQYIKQKTIGKIKLLNRVTSFLPEKLNLSLFKLLIRPHFDYCNVIYGCISQDDAYELTKYVPQKYSKSTKINPYCRYTS